LSFLQLGSLAFLIFISVVGNSDSFSNYDSILFIQILSGVILFTLFKYYLEKLVAYVLGIELMVNTFLYEKISYLNWVGIALWIACLLLYFNPLLDSIPLSILIISYSSLYILSFIVSIKRISKAIFANFFYFILYLCALEIAPYVILYKVFV